MNIPKKYYSWSDIEKCAQSICLQMYRDNWRPDYIVGLTRGGLPLAVMISHMTNIRMEALKVKLRDLADNEDGCVHDATMAEDAHKGTKILIVDDINDTGATFQWIKDDWSGGEDWSDIWKNNVRFAVMTENLASEFHDVQYSWDEVNKAEEDVWLVYPYE
tara:strand:- start:518 stop:1000 length:483 start_codon:yes stop_codon:yes gene_type:complete